MTSQSLMCGNSVLEKQERKQAERLQLRGRCHSVSSTNIQSTLSTTAADLHKKLLTQCHHQDTENTV